MTTPNSIPRGKEAFMCPLYNVNIGVILVLLRQQAEGLSYMMTT